MCAGDRDDGRDDRLTAAVAELYGAAPEAFTGRRAELAAAARDAGDRAAAKAIGALRRPTRAAWVVNTLVRADPNAPAKLVELGAALRAAQEAGHGPRLRELSAARGALVDALAIQALAAASLPDPPPALRLEVSETLTAAIADPEVAAEFATGTLTKAAQWSGFGVLPAVAGADTAAPATAAGTDTERAAPAKVPKARRRSGQATTAGDAEAVARRQAEEAARRQAAEEERLAREAAERAARRRDEYAEAERAVAAAAEAASAAGSAEEQLETEVRELEQRLTQARADLAAARMRARRAETAERRARQAFDRLSAG